jgi:peptide deformylase
MAILKIARMGHPVLGRRAEPVADPAAPEVRRLVRDMIETMADAEGLGLAAPQVHVPRRVVVFLVPGERAEGDDESLGLTVLVNPEIETLGEEIELGWEGCLSVPGLRGLVPRFAAVRYQGFDHEGAPIERQASGLHARVVQHECDHLDGILYPQRMTDLSTLIFESEMKHLAAAEVGEADEGDTEARPGEEPGDEGMKMA